MSVADYESASDYAILRRQVTALEAVAAAARPMLDRDHDTTCAWALRGNLCDCGLSALRRALSALDKEMGR